jgi:hypothetical protein
VAGRSTNASTSIIFEWGVNVKRRSSPCRIVALIFLCSDQWFANMVNGSGQELPLARVVQINHNRNELTLVCSPTLRYPVNLWT